MPVKSLVSAPTSSTIEEKKIGQFGNWILSVSFVYFPERYSSIINETGGIEISIKVHSRYWNEPTLALVMDKTNTECVRF